jgi:protein-arginine kinase activator protein McsA
MIYDDMNKKKKILCPICESPMKQGISEVKGEMWSFFIIGWSYQSLWFDKEKVLKPNRKTNAFRCNKCKMTLTKDNNY